MKRTVTSEVCLSAFARRLPGGRFMLIIEIIGTWLENRYPLAGCDVPSHAYTYQFALVWYTCEIFLVWWLIVYMKRHGADNSTSIRTGRDTSPTRLISGSISTRCARRLNYGNSLPSTPKSSVVIGKKTKANGSSSCGNKLLARSLENSTTTAICSSTAPAS